MLLEHRPHVVSGEAVVPSGQQERSSSRAVPGLSEAVQLCGSDPSPGAPEAAQHAVSRTGQGQQ